MGYVQIDTISVVERAHHHVLWNRLPDYDLGFLNQLVSEKSIFEYWYHAASYMPIADYRFALPNMAFVGADKSPYYNDVDKRLLKLMLSRITAEGPLRLRDFEKDANSNIYKKGGWNQAPLRRAAERLYMQGDLMICERRGMEKVFDISERCLPEKLNLSMPALPEYAAYLFDNTVRSQGVFTWKQLVHLKTGKPIRDAMQNVLNERISSQLVAPVNIAGMPTTYVDVNALEQIQSKAQTPQLSLMSPFDNVLIHRDRLSSLFNYDYTIECYVTAVKRKYGYFCLPILYGSNFVGRIDCKAHRSEKRLEVVSLHLEDVELDQEHFFELLRTELQNFANFNKCPTLDVSAIKFV
ncbi:MAG: hypothetical protein ACJAVV_000854 [Alphaproteobacteria bacterium]